MFGIFRLLRLFIFAAIALFIAMWIADRAEAQVGVDRIEVTDPVSGEIASTTVWYPTDEGSTELTVGPYTFEAAQGAQPNGEAAGLVVISHGSGGSSLSHVSTAVELVKDGFVVAAPKHPGDSFGDWSARGTWAVYAGRPKTISAVIDAVTTDPRFSDALAGKKTGALGLSMGGYTVLALLGAKPDLRNLAAFCRQHASDPYCRLGAHYPSRNQQDKSLEGLADSRVVSAIVMAPATAVFADDAFEFIRSPASFLVAGKDGIVAPDLHAERFRAHWPGQFLYFRMEDAGHASFATPLPARVERQMPAFLRDPEGFDRAGFHRRMNILAGAHFKATLQ